MSGQRIDDHSFWAGAKGKASVFPDGPHKCKEYSSAEGDGGISKYEDTTEAIKEMQVKGVNKARAHKQKDAYRN